MRKDTAPLLEQPALTDQPTTAIATQEVSLPSTSVDMFERLARDPNVPVEKLERLIALQERVLAREAKMAFDEAFAAMQAELPVVPRTRKGDKWMYAPFEEIIPLVRPILQKHGFSLSYETQWPEGTKDILIVGHLTHRQGHERTTEFRAEADKSGSKNAVQAQGSTVQYGRRYTTLDLLGLATGDDDDGKGSEKAGKPDVVAPQGYDEWVTDLTATADNGTPATQQVWRSERSEPFRKYMGATEPQRWAAIKARALAADKRIAANAGKP